MEGSQQLINVLKLATRSFEPATLAIVSRYTSLLRGLEPSVQLFTAITRPQTLAGVQPASSGLGVGHWQLHGASRHHWQPLRVLAAKRAYSTGGGIVGGQGGVIPGNAL